MALVLENECYTSDQDGKQPSIQTTANTVPACLFAWSFKDANCSMHATTPHFSKSEGVASTISISEDIKEGCWTSKFTFFCVCTTKYCNNFLNWRRLLVRELDTGGVSLPNGSNIESLHENIFGRHKQLVRTQNKLENKQIIACILYNYMKGEYQAPKLFKENSRKVSPGMMDWVLIGSCALVMVIVKMVATYYYVSRWNRYQKQGSVYSKRD